MFGIVTSKHFPPRGLWLAGLWAASLIIGPSVQAATSILPLGDSITEAEAPQNSYRRILWRLLQDAGLELDFVGSRQGILDGLPPDPDFDLDHEGHWGWDTQEMLQNNGGLTARLAAYPVDIVLLLLGANDLSDCRGVAATLQGLADIIDVLRERNPAVTVLLGTLLPMDREFCQVEMNTLIVALNAELPGLTSSKSTALSPVILVEQNSGFNISTDSYDGIHPNLAGERKIARRWYEALLPLLGGRGAIHASSFE